MSTYGFFSGNPKTEWLEDTSSPDRDMKLLEAFSFTDPQKRVWLAPAGSVINGASIPRPLWAIVGSPYTDDYRRASIVHDVACEDQNVSRKEADVMFYYACLAGGCNFLQAQMLYAGVRIGAWGDRFLPQEALWRTNILYRPSAVMDTDSQYIENKFLDIAQELEKINTDLSIEQLDTIIQRHLNL